MRDFSFLACFAAEDQSFTVNRDHGMRRTHADVQSAIRRALLTARWVERSDSWIAKHIGCSKETVQSQRNRLEAGGEILLLDPLIGEDGKHYPRTHAATRLVIADNYTLAEWAAVQRSLATLRTR
jgi:hypothetical protein